VIVTGRAIEELLTGHDPYTVSDADDGGFLVVDGLWTEHPIQDLLLFHAGLVPPTAHHGAGAR
jgi:hypothetical protein